MSIKEPLVTGASRSLQVSLAMDRLSCPCLNVSVSCSRSNGRWNSRPVEAGRLFLEGARDRLLSEGTKLFEVDLDVAGVFTEHKVLVSTRLVGDWHIHSCTNCSTDVYLTHSHKEEGGRVFVTGKVLDDPVAIATAKEHERYSKVFKVILHPIAEEESEMFRRRRVASMSFGREDPVMKRAHEQMKSYLNKQQEEMEEKIRQFEAEQREIFTQLQQQAHNERSLLFAAIAKARENVITDAISDSNAAFRVTPPISGRVDPPITQQRVNFAEGKKGQRSPVHVRAPPPAQTVTVTLKDLPMSKALSKPAGVDDELFLLDGFDDDQLYDGEDQVDGGDHGRENPLAFPQSDDEEISTDDSSFRDVSALTQMGMACSVPVTVPMFPTRGVATGNAEHLSSSVKEGVDPSELGDTIRQLALSVHDTGMFGDLPRPRIMGPRGR